MIATPKHGQVFVLLWSTATGPGVGGGVLYSTDLKMSRSRDKMKIRKC
jgi:hypothetical protein